MELLTRNNFEGWMQKILDRLDRQDELLLAIKTQGQQPPSLSEGIRLFDNQDLCLLLQISKRTLQRYRSEGALAYKTLGKKTYYSETDVLDFLSKHVKDFRQNDIERQRKRRITLDEYKERYLQVPRITNRKPVFISEELRNRLDRLVRYHGERGMSASGFVENLLRLHLDALERNFEAWRKL